MKKTLIVIIFFLTLLLGTGVASAHRLAFGFGIFFPPPVVVAPPPPICPYPPPCYYEPPVHYRSPHAGHRYWVPGFWEWRWTPYGWERVWVPGYWKCR